ncbi:MAG: amidohydrolase [Candidatus Undinarchaeales archaeon]|jgi:5-methylthioadenosine/S-adenosylhomocysteine deaminase|nr:amidohydrolase [Candidatus Undinarchaeales archaeon]MDP7492045.1 amidohydrolase [Candidatus Undinarchaeales archaeon]
MLLIKNGLLVTQDHKRRVFRGDVLIDGDRIAKVGKDLPDKVDEVVDASRRIVIPGLINTHSHTGMSFMRGFADDMALMPWLEERIWPTEAKLTEEAVYYSTVLAQLEMVSSGTTFCHDMYFWPEQGCRATETVGMRFAPGGIFLDFPTNMASGPEEYKRSADALCRASKKHPLIYPDISPHAPYTCSEETLHMAMDVARKHEVPIQIHLSETAGEVENMVKDKGKRPPRYLADLGVFDLPTIAFHCVHLDKDDVRLMADKGVTVSHNPTSNMKLAVGGVPPMALLDKVGVPVGLGTDSNVSNNNLDMLEEMKVCALVHKAANMDATVMPARRVMDMATIDAARVMHVEADLGSIEEGKLADMVLLDLDSPRLIPCHDPVSNLVYAAQGGDVTDTLVGGRFLYRDRAFTFPVDDILKRVRGIAKELTAD